MNGRDRYPKQSGVNNSITTQEFAIEEPQAIIDNHDTLKYHLLGPSLTKAGQDSVDQTKVSRAVALGECGTIDNNNS